LPGYATDSVASPWRDSALVDFDGKLRFTSGDRSVDVEADDYAERTKRTVAAWNGMNGRQGGDPAKLAAALVQLASQDEPPLRFAAGADAVEAVETKAETLIAQVDAYRELSSHLGYDPA
jgi:hypothetical protein